MGRTFHVGSVLFGVETEFAYAVLDKHGHRLPSGMYCERLLSRVARRPHLSSGPQRGIFLANGAKCYLDVGHHPEMATPEVLDPWDGCRYVLAGRRIMLQAAEAVAAAHPQVGRVFLGVSNVGYGPVRTTWACHECYAHRCSASTLIPLLVPHLVSRVIYTGAGGFENRSGGIYFMVSPRAAHISAVVSSSSQHSRGLVQAKDEPLATTGHHRLHLLVGESLMSHTAMWLKLGVTAVIVALIDNGRLRKLVPQLNDPIAALHTFAADPTCRAEVEFTNGSRGTAIEIQRTYLRVAEANADHPDMPPWTAEVCHRWGKILDRLEEGPEAVSRTLDWAVKWSLFRQHAEASGFCWDSVTAADKAIMLLQRALEEANGEPEETPVLDEESLRHLGEMLPVHRQAIAMLAKSGLSAARLPGLLKLRNQLWEIDMRFAELTPGGIFQFLDTQRVLQHRVEGVDNIERAMDYPPEKGRAHLRGKHIRQLSGRRNCSCSWTAIWDFDRHCYLDLGDPFESEEHWKPISEEEPPPDSSSDADIPVTRLGRATANAFFDRAVEQYLAGKLNGATRCLDMLLRLDLPGDTRIRIFRLRTWIAARSGRRHAERYLERLVAEPRARIATIFHSLLENALSVEQTEPLRVPTHWGLLDAMSLATDFLFVHRFAGLRPSHGAWDWLYWGNRVLSSSIRCRPPARMAFCEHHGYFLLADGRLDEAQQVLEAEFAPGHCADPNHWIASRGRAILGEVYRRQGDRTRAQEYFYLAQAGQQGRGYLIDMADFTLPGLAKVADDRIQACDFLERAIDIQRRGDNIGLVRSLLLLARWEDNPEQVQRLYAEIQALRESVPALVDCPLLASLLERWDEWSGSFEPDDHGDPFWGL